MGTNGAAQPGAGAYAQVVNAGEDRHGNRCSGTVCGLDHFCLAGHVERRDGDAPQDGKRKNGIEGATCGKKEAEGHHDETDGHGKEAIPMGVVQMGEKVTSQKSGGAENGENRSDPVIGKLTDLEKKWFDVTVGSKVGCRNEQAYEK